ncbi:MAG: hypothetical protein WBA43_04110 [Elainellaceae cyanobacterium]
MSFKRIAIAPLYEPTCHDQKRSPLLFRRTSPLLSRRASSFYLKLTAMSARIIDGNLAIAGTYNDISMPQ